MESPGRPLIITGNWKMYKTIKEGRIFVQNLLNSLSDGVVKPWLAVPFTAIFPLAEMAKGSPLKIGAQNMNDATEGAFTGEIAGKMLIEAGAYFVLLGHSERRRIFHEDNAFINRKLHKSLKDGLKPVLCVGETAQEREAGHTQPVIETQLKECLSGITHAQASQLVVAYEPVWAIGTGINATAEMAQEVHAYCREVLQKLFSQEIAQSIVIQYGGSVNPANAQELLSQPDIDGLLIGGASLSLESFSQIVNDSKLKVQSLR